MQTVPVVRPRQRRGVLERGLVIKMGRPGLATCHIRNANGPSIDITTAVQMNKHTALESRHQAVHDPHVASHSAVRCDMVPSAKVSTFDTTETRTSAFACAAAGLS
jgi:hypothetical protein